MPKLEKLAEDPWALVAFGALLGVWVGTMGERKPDPERGLIMGALGALVMKVVRDAAAGQLTKIAHGWISEPEAPPASPYAQS
ncbi:MAG: hypothetical protein QM831_33065 [Kofleriaceae bacterium]